MGLNEKAAHELAALYARGEVKPVQTVAALRAAIEKRNDALNAYLTLAEPEALGAQLEAAPKGPLWGVPVAVKDLLSTAGLRTTCGSRILEHFVPVYDATAVSRLKAAGAVVLGKTNLDEFGMGSSNENSAYGPVRNPHDPDRVAGGSSGGSAAAVAAGLAPVALGTDTGGSIRLPAAFCGVVGLKPTYGRVSRYGLVAYASSLDVIGTLSRDVRDAALVFDAIAGHDPLDSTSLDHATTPTLDGLNDGVDGLRLGVPQEYVEGLGGEALVRLEDWKVTFEKLGATLVSVSLPHTRYALATYYLISCAEASANLARFDGVRYTERASSRSLFELFAQTRERGFGAEVKRRILLGTYALSAGYVDQFYGKAQRVRALIKRDFENAFQKADVLLAPTSPTPAFVLGEKIDDPVTMYLSDVYTVSINLAGIPAVSVPGGTVEGLPFGLQLIGQPLDEARLLRAARAYEVAR